MLFKKEKTKRRVLISLYRKWIDSGRAEKIALIIFTSLTNDNAVSEDVISAQLLNTSLLRSANFYEAKCFKECNIQAILDIFIGFAVDLSSSKSNQICQVAMDMISKMKTAQPFVVEQATIQPLLNALKSSKNMMDEDEQKNSTRYVEKMTQLMKLLLIFPIEYYEKNERTQTIYLATLIDIWSTHYSSASPLSRARLSLMARILQLRFIDYFSIHSIMASITRNGLEPLVLDWFVSSSQGWDLEDVVLLDSLEHTTSEIDQQVLRKMIMNASSKTPDQHAYRYLQDTLEQRIADLERNDDQVTLVKLIHLLCAINSVLAHRKVSEADLSNIAYAADTMSHISQYIVASLQTGKTTVTTLSKKMSDNSDSRQQIFIDYQDAFVTIKHIFHLTRLVQEYAQIVGPAVDEVIAAEELSKTLTSLASPFIQFLQSALQPNEAGYSVVLNMTTEFIAAFCSVSTRYQQIDITKRVLAAVWFVYSLVYKTGDQASISILSRAFASWIRSLSKEQYEIVFQSFVEQAEEESSNRTDNTREERTLVYLSFFSLLMTNCADSEKSRLKKIIPAIILKLSMIAGKTTSFKYLQELLKMLLQLTGDQSYHFKDYDLSLLLSCLLQIAHPTAPKRFEGQIDAESAKKTFADVCSILINLITHHKEQTVYMMPPFIALVQSLLHCFKSSHVSLVTGKKRKQGDDKTKIKTGRTVSLLTQFAPLDDVSAQRYARVLTTIPQKQHALPTSKSGQTLQRLVAKHTPSILIEYFSIQSNPNMSVVTPSTKSILTNALYDILDVCSEADRNYVLSCLDASGKTLFKSFYTSWKENHKYTGQ
ncbi:Urb2/Npa2 family-domain-containing protein [Choanephora cucurbitarum]|nr:Urb2/Npa2 family-domain-containing protein [Choanephora cucurbitarum]